MLILGFLLFGTGLNLVLGFLVLFKNYNSALRLTSLGLGLLFTAHIWVGYMAVFAASERVSGFLHRSVLGLNLLIGVGLVLLTRRFLRPVEESWNEQGKIPLLILAASILGSAAGVVLCFLDPHVEVDRITEEITFAGPGLLVPIVLLLNSIYSLYQLESTYRLAQDYQRRIGRLCFVGLGIFCLFHIVYFSRVILYHALSLHFVEASSVVYAIVYPVVLAGLLRYRLGSERISIPRDTVYTSVTVFLTGAAFLGVALTVFVFRALDVRLSYIERYLVGFSLCFLVLLVLGSGTVRRRITLFVNRHMYSRKYDYQEQFFRLHQRLMSGSDKDMALTELVENMKYSVIVDDAHFFGVNWQDGNFYIHENKEEATRRDLVISGDSPLVRAMASGDGPVDLLGDSPESAARRAAVREEPMVGLLRLDAVFPVFVGDRLGGMLGLRGGRRQAFDAEDLALVTVFASSIGDVLFKNRVLQERIERKQFESFHHVASFIIHDIKNQIATLNLLMKNAERNLSNPSFQASMMSSIRSCAVNLQGLIDRLAVGPRREETSPVPHPLRPLLEEVAANSGLAGLPNIAFELSGADDPAAPMDRRALFFVMRNLVNNALEAMGGRGRLAISFGRLESGPPARLRELFGGSERMFTDYGAWVLVEDSGPGMSPEFVRSRLFQPFATTKEKGIGIGLYQCRTLVEGMGGRILCNSEQGVGTRFCILLRKA